LERHFDVARVHQRETRGLRIILVDKNSYDRVHCAFTPNNDYSVETFACWCKRDATSPAMA
jgi:hypothetical protein